MTEHKSYGWQLFVLGALASWLVSSLGRLYAVRIELLLVGQLITLGIPYVYLSYRSGIYSQRIRHLLRELDITPPSSFNAILQRCHGTGSAIPTKILQAYIWTQRAMHFFVGYFFVWMLLILIKLLIGEN